MPSVNYAYSLSNMLSKRIITVIGFMRKKQDKKTHYPRLCTCGVEVISLCVFYSLFYTSIFEHLPASNTSVRLYIYLYVYEYNSEMQLLQKN
jgi:hypothetical protein